MKFILDENEYEELQSYKKKYDELVIQESLKKEEFLQEYFNCQKKEGDRLIKVVFEKSPTQSGYTYYAWMEATEDMINNSYRNNHKSEVL